MVFPLIAAAGITAAASLAGSGIAANAAGKASAQAAGASALNTNETRKQNAFERALAQRLLKIQLEGSTDAFGNRTQFLPGRGFVTTPSAQVKSLQDASLAEQLQALTTDAGINREGVLRNAARGRQEDQVAQTELDRFRRIQPVNQNELFQVLLGAGTGAFQNEQDRQLAQVLRQNLRSGGSAAGGEAIAKSAEAGSRARADIGINAKLRSITGAEDITNQRRTNASNLFNLFATRASNSFNGIPFAPEQLSSVANQGNVQARQGALGASQVAGALAGRAPQFTSQPPNFAPALAIQGAGDVLSEFFQKQQQQAIAAPSTNLRLKSRPTTASFFGEGNG